jgi:hypothetical protein
MAATKAKSNWMAVLALGMAAFVLGGCVSPPGTYPDQNGPRNGDGVLVDPHTGVTLPGQYDGGI